MGNPEINNPNPGGILVVARDYGEHEQREGRPLIGPAGQIFDQCLAEAGIDRRKVNVTNVVNERPPRNDFRLHRRGAVEQGLEQLADLIADLRPNVICALGNEAAFATIPGWPSRGGRISGAFGIQDRRGYIYAGTHAKVIPTIHPASILHGAKESHGTFGWVPWRILLRYDLERAKEESHDPEIRRPARNVTIVSTDRDADRAEKAFSGARRLACDIELSQGNALACVGFAPSVSEAFVFVGPMLHRAFDILRRGSHDLVFANGQFDLHYLWTRHEVRSMEFSGDTQLGWHSCYPELAGKSEQKSWRVTRKSLGFLASLFVKDEWWKDYDFETEEDRYLLNGRDCCITLDIMEQLDVKMDQLDVRDIYRHSLDLVWPVVDMQARGLRVDESKRQQRIEQLAERIDGLKERLAPLVIPVLEAHKDELEDVWHLFEKRWTCPCCRNGKKKKEECWSCAGFDKKPGVGQLKEAGQPLGPCTVCSGEGQRFYLEFNPRSTDQKVALLYRALKLPKRHDQGKLSVDEEKLKALLGGLTA